jgi:membrane protein DedA with SNARE-associated domain
MSTSETAMTLVETHGIYLGSFVYSVLSGFIPFMNAELFLLYVGATATPSQLPGVALLATLGQMVAKSALYCGGRGLIPLPRRFGNKALDAVLERLSLRTEAATGVTFVSAVTGLPPFYAISVLAGVLRWPFALFLVAGSFGRVIRFSAVLYLPGLLERNVSMNLEIAALIGLLAGAHTSTWGMYKDCPYEGFTLQKYLRSTFISTTLAICWQWTAGLDLTTASGRLVLFGLTYVTERGLVELYKGFFREEDQSKYFIPMQFHVMGRVIHSRATRWTVAAVWVAVVLFMAWALSADYS